MRPKWGTSENTSVLCDRKERKMRIKVSPRFLYVMVVALGMTTLLLDSMAGLHALAQEPYKIGGTFVLSGDQAEYMKRNYVSGMEMAAEEINAKGGIKGHKLQCIYEDSKGKPHDGVAAIQKLVTIDKVPAVVTVYTFITLAQIPVAEQYKTVLFAASVETPGLTKRSQWLFRVSPDATDRGLRMAEFLGKSLKLKNIAALYEDQEGVRTQVDAFKLEYPKHGGKIVAEETFKQGDIDFKGQIIKLRGANPEAVYIVGASTREKARIFKQVREAGWNIQMLSNHPIEDPEVINVAGGAAEGVIYVGDTMSPEFFAKFNKRFGYDPDVNAGKQFDAVRLLAIAIEKGGYNGPGIAKALAEIRNFPGVLGQISFTADREPGLKSSIKMIKAGKFIPYSPK